jgi:hypothetical protein
VDLSQFTVEVRDRNLVRVGQLTDDDLANALVVPRANTVGSWKIALPATVIHDDGTETPHALCEVLREPGSGIIVTGPEGVILSGPMDNPTHDADTSDPGGTWTIEGISDMHVLDDVLAWGDPTEANLMEQAASNDVRVGQAETLIREYAYYNLGAGALPERRNARFRLEPVDLKRGGFVQKSPRFQNLLELLRELALGSGLMFDVVQTDDDMLELRVTTQIDLSAEVRLDIQNDQLSRSSYGYAAPGVTEVLVAGQGEGVDRTMIRRTSTDSEAARALWNRRRERFLDQRQTDDLTELQQAGDELLADEGVTLKSLQVVPSEDLDLVYGTHWRVGAIVTVVVGAQEIVSVVTEAPFQFGPDGVLAGVTVGDPDGFDWESAISNRTTRTESRVSLLERNAEASGVRIGTIDPYYTAGLPRVKFDGDEGYSRQGFPWMYPYSPLPGDRVVCAPHQGGSYVIQGMAIEQTSTMITISAIGLLNPAFCKQYDATWKEASFTKTPDGIVMLQGLVAITTATAGDYRMFTLPLGFRPDANLTAPASWNNGLGRVKVLANGEVWWISSGALSVGQYLSLGGIAFPAAGVASWTDVLPAGSGGTGAVFMAGFRNADSAIGPDGSADPKVGFWKDPFGFVWWRGSYQPSGTISTDNTPIIDFRSAPIKPSKEVHHPATASGGAMAGVGSNAASNALRYKAAGGGSIGSTTVVSLGGIVMASEAADTNNAWTGFSFINSWKNYSDNFPTGGITNRNGLVMARGLLGGGTINSALANIPSGFRPKGFDHNSGLGGPILARYSNQQTARLDVGPTGNLVPVNGSNIWWSLDGAVWAAEQ